MKKHIYILALSLLCACGKAEKEDEATKRPPIVETGEVVAVNVRAFPMPRFSSSLGTMKIAGLIEQGTEVEPGDSVIQIDPATVLTYLATQETNLETQLAQLEKIYVTHDNTMNEARSRISTETANFELKKIAYESSKFEPEKSQKISELEFRQAEITYAKELKKLEYAEERNKYGLIIQQIRIRQIENNVIRHRDILSKLTFRAPVPGVFQIGRNPSTSSDLYKVGDYAYDGYSIGSIPDLREMKVETRINENDFMKIKEGGKVDVRLDALPDVTFEGEISYIGKLCHPVESGSRQKVFDVEVRMLRQDERLKPGMTVSCEFL